MESKKKKSNYHQTLIKMKYHTSREAFLKKIKLHPLKIMEAAVLIDVFDHGGSMLLLGLKCTNNRLYRKALESAALITYEKDHSSKSSTNYKPLIRISLTPSGDKLASIACRELQALMDKISAIKPD